MYTQQLLVWIWNERHKIFSPRPTSFKKKKNEIFEILRFDKNGNHFYLRDPIDERMKFLTCILNLRPSSSRVSRDREEGETRWRKREGEKCCDIYNNACKNELEKKCRMPERSDRVLRMWDALSCSMVVKFPLLRSYPFLSLFAPLSLVRSRPPGTYVIMPRTMIRCRERAPLVRRNPWAALVRKSKRERAIMTVHRKW